MRFNLIWLTSVALAVCASAVSAQTTTATGAQPDAPTEQQVATAQQAADQKDQKKPASPPNAAPPQKPAAPQKPAPPPKPAPPQKPASTQKPEEEDAKGFRFEMKRRPSLRFGDKARINFRLKAHGDHRSFSPDLRREDRFDLRRLRAGVEGEVLNVVQYEVEYDFREKDYPLRDAFVDIRTSAALQIRGGKFKLPFSREELTGAMNLDFAFRSRAADQLSPGRAVGGMAHGRLFDRRVQYQVGLFREDGENTRRNPLRLDAASAAAEDPSLVSNDASAATWAARGTIRGAGALSALEVGAAMTTGTIPEGRNSVRGRMVFGLHEQLENAVRAPIPSQQIYWSTIVRFQFVL